MSPKLNVTNAFLLKISHSFDLFLEECRTHILLVHKTSETTFHLLLKHGKITFWDLFAHCQGIIQTRGAFTSYAFDFTHMTSIGSCVCVCIVCTGWSFVPCSFDPACQSKARADFCVSAIRERRGGVWMVTYGIPAQAALWSPEEAWKTNRCLHTSLPVLGVHWQPSLQREGTVTAACHSAELRIHKPHTHTQATRRG